MTRRTAVVPGWARLTLALVLVWASSISPASAQPTDQTERVLSGTVADGQDARVSGAIVIAQRGTFARRAQSGADGTFMLRLPPGTYDVRVERAGFGAFTQQVTVAPDRDTAIAVALSVAQITDAVTVSAPASEPMTRARGATRTDTPIIETPQAMSVITAEQIDAQAAQNMQEVVRYAAGVRAEMYGVDNRGDWFTMRGGSEGSTVLDGLRLPLSGWWGNVRNEPYAFERVEVLRGPASVMFGQNGPGGLVNLVSKLPKAERRREVNVQLGNYDQKQIAADLTGPLTSDGRLQYRLVTLFRDAGTQVDLADEERQYIAPSITWQPRRATSLTVFGQYQRDESDNNVGFFAWEGMLLPAPNGRIPVNTFIGEPEWDSYGGHRTRVGYQFEHQLTNAWTVRHNFRFDDVDGHVRGMYANYWEGFLPDNRSVNRSWYVYETDTRIANTDLLAEGKLTLGGIQHTVLVGMDGLWLRDVNPGLSGDATPLDVYTPVYGTFPLPELDFGPRTPINTRQVGVFLQDQIKLAERVVVIGGLRRTYAKTEATDDPTAGSDDAAWSRRGGVVFLASGGWAPYVSYADSFEAVTGADIFGAPYKPKRGQQVEGGVRWSPTATPVIASAAVYDLTEKNRLTTDPDNPLNQIQRGEVSVQGVELEATATLRAWDLVANYTYTDAKVTASSDPEDPYLGRRLHSIPEHSAALWAVHKFSLPGVSGLRAGLGVRYVGETWDGTDTLAVPSATLVDALFSFDHGPVRFALNASNLFDKVYIATCIDRGDCWYGSRRKVIGTISFRR